MAQLGKAWAFALSNDPVLISKAAAMADAMSAVPMNEREQAHLAALSHQIRSARAAGVAVLDQHLMSYPRNIPAHQAAPIYAQVAIPIAEGLAAFHRGAYNQAVAHLLPTRFDLWRIGGSHTQRDVVTWTLTKAAIRAGQRDVALALTYERLGLRPRSIPNQHFLQRAQAMQAMPL